MFLGLSRFVFRSGAFANYVYKIWLFFDHLPPSVYIFYGIKIYKKSIILTTYPPPLVNVVCELPNWFLSPIFYYFYLNTLRGWRLGCWCSSVNSRRKVQRVRLAIEEWSTVRKNFAYISSQVWSDQSLCHGRESRYHDSNSQNCKNSLKFSIGR